MNKVDPFEAEMAACAAQVSELQTLKAESVELYKKAIKDLQGIARGETVGGPFEGFSVDLADAVLMDLGEEKLTDTPDSRREIEKILAHDSEVEFMGDPEHFVSIDDALASGELREEAL